MNDLSLTQKYLIVAVNDRGQFSSLDTNGPLCLVIAGLLELELDEVVVIEDKRVRTCAPLPREKGWLAPIYDEIREKEPVKVEKVVNALYMTLTGKPIEALLDGGMESLRARKLTRKVERGFISRRTGLAPREEAVEAVLAEVESLLDERAPLSESLAALVLLLDKAGALRDHFEKDALKAMKERIADYAQSPNGKLAAELVQQIEMLMAVVTITAVLN